MRKQKVANSFLTIISKVPECVIKAEPNQVKTKTNHLEEASSEELPLKSIARDQVCFEVLKTRKEQKEGREGRKEKVEGRKSP